MADDNLQQGATALDWIAEEQAYSQQKWPPEASDQITRDEEWDRWLSQYLHRANLLGFDTEVGRQALAKYVTTAVAMLDSVTRVHGPLPAPGVPSGEIQRWRSDA